MIRAIAKQAEAERERRAKIIHADGEFEARRSDWSRPRSGWRANPAPCKLRYLQTLTEIAAGEKSSTIVFPLPMNVMDSLGRLVAAQDGDDGAQAEAS